MSKAQRLIDRYDEIAEKAGFVIASFGLEIQDRDKRIADLVAENERLENLLAEGVHSCSKTCKRPMCVLRREKAELEQQLVDLREENAYLIGDALRYRLLRDADNYPGDEGEGPSKWDELCDLTLEDFDNWIDRNLMGKQGQELPKEQYNE